MITSCKKDNLKDKKELVYIKFLNQDGLEFNSDIELVNNGYVSKEDHKTFGKVEGYSNGKVVSYKYFLKQYRGGRPGELLVDPYGMMSKVEDLSAFVTQRGGRFCEYISVTEDIYNTYLLYLRSRDSRYFRSCEKYLLDKVL